MGYIIDDQPSGFYCILIPPKEENKYTLYPVIAFRGTEPSLDKPADIFTDLDWKSPGYSQFTYNKDKITVMLATSKVYNDKVDLTGHSLGGALCQWTATSYSPANFHKIITFQSPAISAANVTAYTNSTDEKPEVIHHIANDDVVDFAGEASIPGTFFLHNTQTNNFGVSHLHLFLTEETFRTQREQLGLDTKTLQDLGIGPAWNIAIEKNVATERNMIQEYNVYPFLMKRLKTEIMRKYVAAHIEMSKDLYEAMRLMQDVSVQMGKDAVGMMRLMELAVKLGIQIPKPL